MKFFQKLACNIVVGLMSSSTSSLAVTEHDNAVEFKSCPDSKCSYMTPGSQVNSIVFYYDGGYSVTSGQPWDGVTTNNNAVNAGYPDYQVDVYAGRKSSEPPADFFNQRAGTTYVGPCNSDTSPFTAMNFALTGVLEIEGNDYQIVIGQAAFSGSNCWFLGPNESGFNLIYNNQFIDSERLEEHYLITPDHQYRLGLTGIGHADTNIFYISEND